MPFVSEAQRRKFYSTPDLHKYINEYNSATPKGKKLPNHVADKKPALHQAAVNHMKKRKRWPK